MTNVIDALDRFAAKVAADHPPEWTIAELRRMFAPSVKVLPFVTRNSKHPLDGQPLTWWNDTPGVDHKLDHKRGVTYANMLIEAVAADQCSPFPLEAIFKSIIEDTAARKIKGGKHSRTLPPAVDGFLWTLSKFIAAKTPTGAA